MLVVIGFYSGGVWNYLAIAFAFVFIPALDQFIGTDTTNVEDDQKRIISEDRYYRILMALVPPVWFRKMNGRLEHWSAKIYQQATLQQT